MKILKTMLKLLAVMVLLGFLSEHICRWYYDKQKPESREFLYRGDREIHYKKTGSGGPTIVFESGMGGDYLHWEDMRTRLEGQFTVLSYDKAGILWSQKAHKTSLNRFSEDLYAVLKHSGCPKPYILVGHSFAGITLRKFVHDYSEDIKGIVFVDVTHPQQLIESSDELRKGVGPPPVWLINFLNEIGVLRLVFSMTPFTRAVPEDHYFNRNVANYFYRIWPGLAEEYTHDDQLMAEAIQYGDFKNIPLTVISAAYPNGLEGIRDEKLAGEYKEIHKRLQSDLLGLSAQSKQIIATHSGHYIAFEEPELVLAAIQELSK